MNSLRLGKQMVGLDTTRHISCGYSGESRRRFRTCQASDSPLRRGRRECRQVQNFRAPKIVSDHGFRALGAQVSHQAGWKKKVLFEVYHDATVPGNGRLR